MRVSRGAGSSAVKNAFLASLVLHLALVGLALVAIHVRLPRRPFQEVGLVEKRASRGGDSERKPPGAETGNSPSTQTRAGDSRAAPEISDAGPSPARGTDP